MFHNVLRVFHKFMMFHNVLRVFHDVLLVVRNVLQVFHDVLLCFTMFSESRNDRHCRIGDCMAVDRLRDCENSAGIGDNSAEIGDDTAGIIDIAAKVISC